MQQVKGPNEAAGLDAFIAGVSGYAAQAVRQGRGNVWFVRRIAEAYAFIRLEDIGRPARFLRQMAGVPPVQFGTSGFKTSLVDDPNPARHYTAFVFIGFFLSYSLAVLVLWMWEIAGFIRYRGEWSWPDIANGRIGIRHGELVRRYGPTVLPGLIARDLAEPRV